MGKMSDETGKKKAGNRRACSLLIYVKRGWLMFFSA
jgi:hypothetical protein